MLPPLTVRADLDPILPFLAGHQTVSVHAETHGGKWDLDRPFTRPADAFEFAKTVARPGFYVGVYLSYDKRNPLPDLHHSKGPDPKDPEFDKKGGTWADVSWVSEDGSAFEKRLEEFGYYDALGRKVPYAHTLLGE